MGALDKEPDNKKLKELFVESAKMLELVNMDELQTLAETMVGDMPESEKGKEADRLKEIEGKRSQCISIIAEGKKKYNIWTHLYYNHDLISSSYHAYLFKTKTKPNKVIFQI